MRAAMYSMISDSTRYMTQSPVIGLNFARVGFEERGVPYVLEEDHADRITYAARAPRNGRATVMLARSCS